MPGKGIWAILWFGCYVGAAGVTLTLLAGDKTTWEIALRAFVVCGIPALYWTVQAVLSDPGQVT